MINIELENMIAPSQGVKSVKKEITKPISPKLKTKERNELKDHFQRLIGQEEEEQATFKARDLNKKILTSVSKLPEVCSKDKTSFSEFKLSKSNKFEKENLVEEF